MKNKNTIIFRISAAAICLLMLLCTVACSNISKPGSDIKNELWISADYTDDTTFGNGEKTVHVKVVAMGQEVVLTLKTDKKTLGEALIEHGLIEGESGAYGLFVNVVNGITADYNSDGAYWGFFKNGELMNTGVDGTVFADGEHYELVYIK